MKLLAMPDKDYSDFMKRSIERFINDNSRKDDPAFRQKVTRSLEALLPDGVQTSGQFFYQAWSSTGKQVAEIWVGRNSDYPDHVLWGWDFHVLPEFQNRTYGYRILKWMPDVMRDLGFSDMRVVVYKTNNRARRLYDRLGFEVVSESDEQLELSYSVP